ncbi:hypothetical protein BLSMQ_1390 [Brevibacterium aurantiacum]|uniref:Uncharacterized protein n=1 Tax=Brevibacterium aurantiacum TaxID=273384 RepID=A0A1D7W2A0_BREAU|nr:hypothetical protein BLSMQ_1390 [Brevibacterium aurantiacum]
MLEPGITIMRAQSPQRYGNGVIFVNHFGHNRPVATATASVPY